MRILPSESIKRNKAKARIMCQKIMKNKVGANDFLFGNEWEEIYAMQLIMKAIKENHKVIFR